MVRSQSADSSEYEDQTPSREVWANGICMKTSEVEAKLDEGNIQEAESSLREGLSLNFEEARALLGRLEYQRGNVEAALHVFDGIDLQVAIQRLQPSFSEKQPSRKGRSRGDSQHAVSQHSASLVLEAIYLKAKSLQKLGRLNDAAHECKRVLDAVEKIFHQGIPDVQVDNRLQDTVRQAVELLPELLKQAGCYQEAMSAYRRALLSQWNLDDDNCSRIQKAFAVFLMHSGVEAGPPSLAAQVDGSYVPKHNLEEAILLLMILVRKFYLGKIVWDPSVLEHLTFALSLCGQTSVLAKELEEIMPGVFHRVDRWNTLALCYSAVGQNTAALNLLRKSLHKHEQPDDLIALLLAAKICCEDSHLAAEGVGYAQRAIANAQGRNEHLKGVAIRILGLCSGKQATISPSDFERSRLQSEALKLLDAAISLEKNNPDLLFELGMLYAEQRNLNTALRYAKQFVDATGGSLLKGWRLLALILSAQQRFSEAEVVIDAALDETAKWEQGPLLRLKAKLKTSQSLPMDAIETYRYLLALVQAQRKSFGPLRSVSQAGDDRVNEYEVWHGLADLYSRLSHWKDMEVCLGKAGELKQYSAEVLYTEGVMLQGRGKVEEAMSSYINALLLDPSFVRCKILIGALLSKRDTNALPVARSILSDALKIEPTNRMAWYYLGIIHRVDGRIADAADCFQAASMLEESDPIENFSSIL
ncbi:PREDICTED: tetratricopeptide repeat protein 7A [Populus euphratica]|uniref:Tetratricopeptide repeat protein 7A n=1 Tax=Populus euphratica TaxID=75702 RepID=A0AAJ6UA79_POPEU|nr:PREDICTED: tetratricopeptide repeat protein 7A [Populus euphratica]XP_011026196.1 PREDICTED: tetratricopeptide repeat protein 7A [Populus euphratica]XP_011026197.1 PREDICTED: tetratricopeptide repeat protein 7A [Populus euphratica]